jgi:hypothetical protein
MSDYTTADAVNMAMEKNVAGFREAISDILLDKIQNAVEVEKVKVAAGFMAEPEEEGDYDVD